MPKRSQRLLSLILSLCLVTAQTFLVVPAIAAGSLDGGRSAQVTPAAPAHHDHSGMSVSAEESAAHTGCASHDSCGGLCCVGCAHCVTGMPGLSWLSSPPRAVQSPVVHTLHLSHPVSILGRPPKA